MGAVVGVLIFIALVYYVIKYFENVKRARYDKILEDWYNALKDDFENVGKIKNGFTWESDINISSEKCLMHITVEHKDDARDVFVKQNDDTGYGLLIRYFIKDEHLETYMYDFEEMKDFSAKCDGKIVKPWYVIPIKIDGIQHVCYSIFIPTDNNLAELLERNIEKFGAQEALRKYLYKLFVESFSLDYLKSFSKYKKKLDEYYEELYDREHGI